MDAFSLTVGGFSALALQTRPEDASIAVPAIFDLKKFRRFIRF
jgi:hypothetical protein